MNAVELAAAAVAGLGVLVVAAFLAAYTRWYDWHHSASGRAMVLLMAAIGLGLVSACVHLSGELGDSAVGADDWLTLAALLCGAAAGLQMLRVLWRDHQAQLRRPWPRHEDDDSTPAATRDR